MTFYENNSTEMTSPGRTEKWSNDVNFRRHLSRKDKSDFSLLIRMGRYLSSVEV